MFYVYCRHIDSGREDFCGKYETMKQAQEKIRICIKADENNAAKDEYYYFIKEH